MALYMLEFPVRNTIDGFSYTVSLHFKSETCPTREQVLQAIDLYHKRDSKYPEYINEWMDVRKVVENIDEFPHLIGNRVESFRIIDLEESKYMTLRKVEVTEL